MMIKSPIDSRVSLCLKFSTQLSLEMDIEIAVPVCTQTLFLVLLIEVTSEHFLFYDTVS